MIQISILKVNPTYAQSTWSSDGCRVIQGKTGMGGHGARWWRRWGEAQWADRAYSSWLLHASKVNYIYYGRAVCVKREPLWTTQTRTLVLPFLPSRFDCFFNPKIMLKSDSWVVSSSNRKELQYDIRCRWNQRWFKRTMLPSPFSGWTILLILYSAIQPSHW